MSNTKTQIIGPKGSKHPGRQFLIYIFPKFALKSWVCVKSNSRVNSVGQEGFVA
jgi:hypothetical protein